MVTPGLYAWLERTPSAGAEAHILDTFRNGAGRAAKPRRWSCSPSQVCRRDGGLHDAVQRLPRSLTSSRPHRFRTDSQPERLNCLVKAALIHGAIKTFMPF